MGNVIRPPSHFFVFLLKCMNNDLKICVWTFLLLLRIVLSHFYLCTCSCFRNKISIAISKSILTHFSAFNCWLIHIICRIWWLILICDENFSKWSRIFIALVLTFFRVWAQTFDLLMAQVLMSLSSSPINVRPIVQTHHQHTSNGIEKLERAHNKNFASNFSRVWLFDWSLSSLNHCWSS